MTKRWTAIAGVAITCAGAAACKGKADKSSSASGNAESSESNTAEAPARVVHALGMKTPTLTLLLPGEEPRRVPAYGSVGSTRGVALAVEMSSANLPAEASMTFDLDLVWRPISGGPGERRAFSVRSAKLTQGGPPMGDGEREIVAGIMKLFEKVSGHASIMAPHHVSIVQTEGLPSTPSLPLLLHQFIVPLPALEVGKGARWSVLQPIRFPGGLVGTDNRMYELVEIGDQGATVQISGKIELEAKAQAPSTNATLGATITVVGELEVGFADVLPISGELRIQEETRVYSAPPGSLPHKEGPKEHLVRATVRAKLSSN